MKVKRFFANAILLIIVAGAVFFVGWISFYVKPGQCAIMNTKTGGLYPEPIVYGQFKWRWERLLPTNVQLSCFRMKEHSFVQTVSGTLPSAELYKTMLSPKPDFSYNFTVKMIFSIEPEKILNLVKTGSIENTEDSLEQYLQTKSVLAANQIASYIISNPDVNATVGPSVLSESQIRQAISGRLGEFDGLTIDSVELAATRVPDVRLYEKAKESYEKYLEDLNAIISQKAGEQAASILQLENSMKQLEQFANLLERYPRFNDFSKSENLSPVMEKLIQQ